MRQQSQQIAAVVTEIRGVTLLSMACVRHAEQLDEQGLTRWRDAGKRVETGSARSFVWWRWSGVSAGRWQRCTCEVGRDCSKGAESKRRDSWSRLTKVGESVEEESLLVMTACRAYTLACRERSWDSKGDKATSSNGVEARGGGR